MKNGNILRHIDNCLYKNGKKKATIQREKKKMLVKEKKIRKKKTKINNY